MFTTTATISRAISANNLVYAFATLTTRATVVDAVRMLASCSPDDRSEQAAAAVHTLAHWRWRTGPHLWWWFPFRIHLPKAIPVRVWPTASQHAWVACDGHRMLKCALDMKVSSLVVGDHTISLEMCKKTVNAIICEEGSAEMAAAARGGDSAWPDRTAWDEFLGRMSKRSQRKLVGTFDEWSKMPVFESKRQSTRHDDDDDAAWRVFSTEARARSALPPGEAIVETTAWGVFTRWYGSEVFTSVSKPVIIVNDQFELPSMFLCSLHLRYVEDVLYWADVGLNMPPIEVFMADAIEEVAEKHRQKAKAKLDE